MNETITQIQESCPVHWAVILYFLVVGTWYLIPVMYHAAGWCMAWLDDARYEAKWSPWYGAWKLTRLRDKNYDWEKYLWRDHEDDSLFWVGWALGGVVVFAVMFPAIFMCTVAFFIIAHLARFVKRLQKQFKEHVANKDAHK